MKSKICRSFASVACVRSHLLWIFSNQAWCDVIHFDEECCVQYIYLRVEYRIEFNWKHMERVEWEELTWLATCLSISPIGNVSAVSFRCCLTALSKFIAASSLLSTAPNVRRTSANFRARSAWQALNASYFAHVNNKIIRFFHCNHCIHSFLFAQIVRNIQTWAGNIVMILFHFRFLWYISFSLASVRSVEFVCFW